MPCDCVLNSKRDMFGTAKPTKAIGPQKAVIKPVKIAVIPIVTKRMDLTFKPNENAACSPKTKAFNGLIKKKLKKSPLKKTKIMIGSWAKVTCCKEPIVHIVKDFNSSEALFICKIEINELVKLPSIKPINNNEICERIKDENPMIISPNTNAPINALEMIPKSLVNKGIPVINVQATNKLEPVLIPST